MRFLLNNPLIRQQAIIYDTIGANKTYYPHFDSGHPRQLTGMTPVSLVVQCTQTARGSRVQLTGVTPVKMGAVRFVWTDRVPNVSSAARVKSIIPTRLPIPRIGRHYVIITCNYNVTDSPRSTDPLPPWPSAGAAPAPELNQSPVLRIYHNGQAR